MSTDVKLLDASIRHQPAVLVVEIRCALHGAIKLRSHEFAIAGRNVPEHEVERGFDRPVDPEDPISLLRPDDIAAGDIPAETAGMAELLGVIEIGLALAQGDFGLLLVVDVEGHAVPLKHLSALVTQRYASDRVPSVLTVGPAYALVHLERIAGCQVSAQCVLEQSEILGMNDDFPGPAPHALLRQAGIGLPRPVDEIERAVVLITSDQERNHIDRRLKLPFSLAGLLFGRFAFGILAQQLLVDCLEVLNRVL